MKNRIIVGIILGLAYMVFIASVPHKYIRTQGMETDLVMTYIPAAEKFNSLLTGEYNLYEAMRDPFNLHGIGYSAVLWFVGQFGYTEKPGWEYFIASKWISMLSAGAVIALAVIWLGIFPGIISAVALGLSALFFELSYSGCTDMFALALGLWAAYLIVKKKPLWAGVLLGFVCCFRYEYFIFAPFFVWYLWQTKRPFWVSNGWWKFVLPLAVLMTINFSIAGFSTGGYTNTILHYLNGEKQPDEFVMGLMEEYPTTLSVIMADPVNTLRIFARDTISAFRGIGFIQVWPVLFLGGVLMLGRMPLPLLIGILVHFIVVAFSALHWETIRYFLPEIALMIFLGSVWLSGLRVRRWLIVLAVLPSMLIHIGSLSGMVNSQKGRSAEIYLPLAQGVNSDDVILSVRPQVSFMLGCKWKYWEPEMDVTDPVLWENVDYLLWDGFSSFHRIEWRETFSKIELFEKYFDGYFYDQRVGILCKLKQP